ncbi:MAG: hydantoinase/oxoprolinase family protein, partial [Bacteroidota bacterium]
MNKAWQIWIDTGGTFTDCMAIHPAGHILRAKVLSSSRLRGKITAVLGPKQFVIQHNWATNAPIFEDYTLLFSATPEINTRVEAIDFAKNILKTQTDLQPEHLPVDFEITAHEEAPVLACRILTQTPLKASFPPIDLRLGSTKGTNALLERKGSRICLLITKGFADLPAIGSQERPHLFQLDIPEKKLLQESVIEVDERILPDGQVEKALSQTEIDRLIKLLKEQAPEAIALALMHSYKNPRHEQILRQALTTAGFSFLSVSSELSPNIKLLSRTQTALVDAYLSPILNSYLSGIHRQLPAEASFRVMTSAGGLATIDRFAAKDSLLSGPAGGVVGAAHIAARLGVEKILTLDMGGTSTDTARFAGSFDYKYLTTVGDTHLQSPSLDVETVAAGGGSICGFDGHKLFVGPESAGAQPGPACYGAGGPLTITDVNLLLSKIDSAIFPIPIHLQAAQNALEHLQASINQVSDTFYTTDELLKGFERIANEKMADAIRKISVLKGFDPRDYSLLVFGGAGGLHACAIAKLLGVKQILLPYDGGILSAYGMGQAKIRQFEERQILQLLDNCKEKLKSWVTEMSQAAFEKLQSDGYDASSLQVEELLFYLRFKGQDSSLELAVDAPDDFAEGEAKHELLKQLFEKKYRDLFGHWPIEGAIELESIKLIAAEKGLHHPMEEVQSQKQAASVKHHLQHPSNPQRQTPVYDWDELKAGAFLHGPAILLNRTSTTYIEAGWLLQIHADRNATLRWLQQEDRDIQHQKEAIELELFTNRFSAIALEMGARLQRTAFSVNIKERLDFSCAVLDVNAELLVNAPHIPVHLGSLGICARLVLEKIPLGPGDVAITNHPKYGGSHLPDVTLLAGVFDEKDQLIAYVINRAHHAEIGGKRPGSMPPDARFLAEEGVVIPPTYLLRKGKIQWQAIHQRLTEAAYPSRSPNENLADINAALASLRSGQQALQDLCRRFGRAKLHHYMAALKELSAAYLKNTLRPYHGQVLKATERLDDGHQIVLSIRFEADQIGFDFSGTSPV